MCPRNACRNPTERKQAMTLESKSDITDAVEPAREEDLLMGKVTHTPARKTHRKLKIVLMAVLAVIVAGAIGFGVYVGDYYHADDAALAAMESADAVAVRRLEDGDIAFVPGDPRVGIVFYPGGKVQAETHASLMRGLADRGFLCVIVPMPFNLAVFDANGADGVQERFPAVRRWILMGHSLGGVIAASYLDGHARSWDGLVLLGACSTADLSDDGVTVLSITGDSDGVLNRRAAADNEGNLGEDARELVIFGGNHAQFGSYGPQDGDGEASLSPEEQRALTADEIAGVFL